MDALSKVEVQNKSLAILQGHSGTGKTTMLRLLAEHRGMEVVFVHEDSDADFLQTLKTAKEKGLSAESRVWVFEHFDSLSIACRRALLKALPLQGYAFATSWFTDENMSDVAANWITLDPWDHASRVHFMYTFRNGIEITDDDLSACLRASSDDIAGAWTIAQTRIPSSSDMHLRAPPSNLRILVDRSLSLSGTRNELDMLQDCDDDLCLSLVQEALPLAVAACFPKKSVDGLTSLEAIARGMDALSACDACAGFSGLVKNAFIGGTLQATLPLPLNYSSGISFSIPKSAWSKHRPSIDKSALRILKGMPKTVDEGGVDIDPRLDLLSGWGEDDTILHHIVGNPKKEPKREPKKGKKK